MEKPKVVLIHMMGVEIENDIGLVLLTHPEALDLFRRGGDSGLEDTDILVYVDWDILTEPEAWDEEIEMKEKLFPRADWCVATDPGYHTLPENVTQHPRFFGAVHYPFKVSEWLEEMLRRWEKFKKRGDQPSDGDPA